MTSSAGPSPAVLGVIALASFAGLVLAAFASGYHLVGGGEAGSTSTVSESVGVEPGEADAPGRAAFVRELGQKERAVVRVKPEGEVVEQLKPGQAVTVLDQNGDWYRIRYERDGQTRDGWTLEGMLRFP
jgi:uncharacterized protein YgiM (DUF1202 family)